MGCGRSKQAAPPLNFDIPQEHKELVYKPKVKKTGALDAPLETLAEDGGTVPAPRPRVPYKDLTSAPSERKKSVGFSAPAGAPSASTDRSVASCSSRSTSSSTAPTVSLAPPPIAYASGDGEFGVAVKAPKNSIFSTMTGLFPRSSSMKKASRAADLGALSKAAPPAPASNIVQSV